MREDRSISIWDLFINICMAWRKGIVYTLLLALLFGGFSYYRSVQNIKNEKSRQEQVVMPEQTMKDLNLDDDSIARIQNYVSLKGTYNKMAFYSANSVLMQLNPNAVPTYKMTYAIKTKGNPKLIYDAYCSMLFSDELCGRMNEQIDLNLPIEYLQELVNVKSDSLIIKDVQFVLSESDIEIPDCSVSMTISTYFYEKDTCEKLNSVVADYIEECTKSLGNSGMEPFSITKISTTYSVAAVPDLLTKQTTQNNTMNFLKTFMDTLQKSMSDEEKAYLEAYQMQKEQEVGDTDEPIDAQESKEESEMVKPSVSKMYVLLGALLGIFVVVGFTTLQYILSGKVHYCDELDELFHLHVFGCLSDEKKKLRGIDAWLDKLKSVGKRRFSSDETLRMIVAGIKIICIKENKRNVYLTGCCIGEKEKEYIQRLTDLLKQESIAVESGNSVLYDPESLERMASCDAVVLMERIEESTCREIEKELEICKQQEISAVGAIVIE